MQVEGFENSVESEEEGSDQGIFIQTISDVFDVLSTWTLPLENTKLDYSLSPIDLYFYFDERNFEVFIQEDRIDV